MMSAKDDSLANALVRLGRGPAVPGRAVDLPLDQSSTLLFDRLAEFYFNLL